MIKFHADWHMSGMGCDGDWFEIGLKIGQKWFIKKVSPRIGELISRLIWR